MKLQTKILGPGLTFVVLLVGSLSIVFSILLRTSIEREFEKRGSSVAASLASNGRLGVLLQDSTQLSALLDGSMTDPEILFVGFYDTDGGMIIQRGIPPVSGMIQAASSGDASTDQLEDMNGSEVQRFVAPVMARGSVIGRVAVHVSLRELNATFTTFYAWSTGLGVFFFGLTVVLVYLIMRALRPLRQLAEDAAQIAAGDLTVEVTSHSKDEVGQLAQAFDTMVANLRRAIRQVSEVAESVASASSEISVSTEQMAAGAQEQSSQATGVWTAVNQMTQTIFENSRNAGSAAEIAEKARGVAAEGGNVIRESIEGMRRIAHVVRESAQTVHHLGGSSDAIGEIISVIDDIADQTNLLALNAAIEAARAGEHGRGFAVVADEVRVLAERTTKATKQIAEMIKKIQSETQDAVAAMEQGTKEVDRGIAMADAGGNALTDIVDISRKVSEKVTQIATASEQQAGASEEISKNVEAINNVTKETATGIQQVARTAEDLNRLTEKLQELISRFKVNGGTERSDPGRVPVRAHGRTAASAGSQGRGAQMKGSDVRSAGSDRHHTHMHEAQ